MYVIMNTPINSDNDNKTDWVTYYVSDIVQTVLHIVTNFILKVLLETTAGVLL